MLYMLVENDQVFIIYSYRPTANSHLIEKLRQYLQLACLLRKRFTDFSSPDAKSRVPLKNGLCTKSSAKGKAEAVAAYGLMVRIIPGGASVACISDVGAMRTPSRFAGAKTRGFGIPKYFSYTYEIIAA